MPTPRKHSREAHILLSYVSRHCLRTCVHSPPSLPRSRRSAGRPGPQLAGVGPPRAGSSRARPQRLVQHARQRCLVATPGGGDSYSHVRRAGPLASFRAGRPLPRAGERNAPGITAGSKIPVVRERRHQPGVKVS